MTARIFVPFVVVALIIVSAVSPAACGSDDGTTSTEAVSTSVTGESTTSTSTALPGGSTTTTPTSVATSESTSSTGGPTTTEALSSAETRLPNGNIKAMGYIDAVWEDGDTRYLSIDYAEMLTGQEAVDAAVEEGFIAPGEDLPNDYFIINVNPQKREFTVAGDAMITTATFGGGMEQSVSWDVFTSFWTEFTPEGGEHLSEMPWWIERDGDTVVKIAEQYLP